MKKVFISFCAVALAAITFHAHAFVLQGDPTPGGWDPTQGVELPYVDDGSSDHYNGDVHVTAGLKYYSFSQITANPDWGQYDWADINMYRFLGDFDVQLDTPTRLNSWAENGRVETLTHTNFPVDGTYNFDFHMYTRMLIIKLVEADDPTAINDVNSNDVTSVKYVNVQGQTADTPFNGVNIVVTTHNDGTTTTTKIVK